MTVVTLAGLSGLAVGTSAAIADVHYGPETLQTMKVYPATTAALTASGTTSAPPLVILVHGGGWREGSDRKLEDESAELQAAGFAVADIDYRLDSESTRAFVMEVEDIESATRFAREHATEWNADPTRIEYVGGSAGGNLVAIAAEHMDRAGEPIAKVVTLSGAFNLVTLDKEREWLRYIPLALGCTYKERGCLQPGPLALAAANSPALGVDASTCSSEWLLFNSSEEFTRLDQPEGMIAALAGCSAELHILPGTLHAFHYWPTVAAQIKEFLG